MSARLMVALTPFVAMGTVRLADAPATTTRYRIESKTEQVVDLSGMGQGNQTNAFTQIALISVTLSDTAGGKVMHVAVDSISSDAPVVDPSMDPAKAKGAWLHGFIDPWGRTKIVASSSDSNLVVAQLKNSMARFLPVVKPGAKAGESWVDTNHVATKNSQQAMKTTTVTTYTKGGAETRDGQPATRIEAKSATSGAGTMENPMAGTMDVELTSSATEVFFVAGDGRYLGGEAKTNGKSMVRMAMAPDPFPVTITSATTVTVVK